MVIAPQVALAVDLVPPTGRHGRAELPLHRPEEALDLPPLPVQVLHPAPHPGAEGAEEPARRPARVPRRPPPDRRDQAREPVAMVEVRVVALGVVAGVGQQQREAVAPQRRGDRPPQRRIVRPRPAPPPTPTGTGGSRCPRRRLTSGIGCTCARCGGRSRPTAATPPCRWSRPRRPRSARRSSPHPAPGGPSHPGGGRRTFFSTGGARPRAASSRWEPARGPGRRAGPTTPRGRVLAAS